MEIYFVTSNKKKVDEMSYYLKTDLKQLNIEIEEIQGSEEEIAIDKLLKACKLNENKFTIIDDCSLDIKGLSGFPGPYFKDFISLGLDALDKIVNLIGRRAIAKCIIGFGIYKNGKFNYKLFYGPIPGNIKQFTGQEKHFDDLFVPDSIGRPYSDLSLEESKLHNHRGVAAQGLREYLNNSEFNLEINR
ncbi:Protein ham1 [Nosema bombycis CQ1]|uniref:Protein ham1 n=1 Tax=Nosema bombycis (strain CQ1 / CVCC 102059) TaxID=578461 RepID=R0MJ90_NOSB1|nr:Protein ham1 [Nosema bombycis CQ1]|eukprot:EOB12838.1 Protein ham1 [Nosema bombycis CQ1]